MFEVGDRVRVIAGEHEGDTATVAANRDAIVPGAPSVGVRPDVYWGFGGPDTIHFVHIDRLEKID